MRHILLLSILCSLTVAIAEQSKPSRFHHSLNEAPISNTTSVLKAGQTWAISQLLPSGQTVQAKILLNQAGQQQENANVMSFISKYSGVFFDKKNNFMGFTVQEKRGEKYIQLCLGEWNDMFIRGVGLYLTIDDLKKVFEGMPRATSYNPILFKKYLNDQQVPYQVCTAQLEK